MKLIVLIKLMVGITALLLGAAGLFLPVWPTTPFVLLAVGCFSSTPKIQAKILAIPVVREYYDSYTGGCGLRRSTVVFSLCFLWGMLILSMLLTGKLWITLLLAGIGSAVTVHVVWISKKRAKKMVPWRKQKNEA